jgi:nucleotide-binding universal stress UspA family protein
MENIVSLDKLMYCKPGHLFCRAQKVLLAVDGSEGSANAATVGFEIAEMTKSQIFIVYVVPAPAVKQYSLMSGSDPKEVLEKYKENGRRLLEGYKSAAVEHNLNPELIIEEGLPPNRIIAQAKEKGVDMIIMGSRGSDSVRRAGMGSSTERVVAGSECTVVVVK